MVPKRKPGGSIGSIRPAGTRLGLQREALTGDTVRPLTDEAIDRAG